MRIQVQKLRDLLAIMEEVSEKGFKTASYKKATQYTVVGDGYFRAANLNMALRVRVPEASEGEPFTIPTAAAIQVLKYWNGLQDMEVEAEKGSVTLRSVPNPTLNIQGSTSTSLTNIQASEVMAFHGDPKGPDDSPPMRITVDGNRFLNPLPAIAAYANSSDERPVMHGILLELGSPVRAIATDGFRLAYRDLPVHLEGVNMKVIISRDVIHVLAALWKARPSPPDVDPLAGFLQVMNPRRPLQLTIGNKAMIATFGPAGAALEVAVKLIEGTFPAWTQIVPAANALVHQATVDADQFNRAVKQTVQFAKETRNILRLSWGPDGLLTIGAKSDAGTFSTQIRAEVEGPPIEVAMNHKFLLTYLAEHHGQITLAAENPSKPVVLHNGPKDGEGHVNVLLMPMSFDKPVPPEAKKQPEAKEEPADAVPTAEQAEEPEEEAEVAAVASGKAKRAATSPAKIAAKIKAKAKQKASK